jgi:DNA repair exonuclease SbcCD nuclease subunit
MANCKILHTADWHLRDSQYSTVARGDDFTKAAFNVLDIAMGHGVNAICNSGDILNNKRPSSKNIRDLVEIDRRLQEAKIPMYVISGNHDLASPSWISLVDEETNGARSDKKIYGIIDADDKFLTIPGTEITLYGAPYKGSKLFRDQQASWPEADILMSHELVKEFAAFQASEESLSIADYPCDKYQAVLLGDIHTNVYRIVNGTVIGYPGSVELCSSNENIEKYVTLFELEDGKLQVTLPARTLSIATREAKFYQIRDDIALDTALQDVQKCVKQDPIIVVKYDRRMVNVPMAFMTVTAGTKSILRCAAFSDVNANKLLGLGSETLDANHIKSPADFVENYIDPKTDLYTLAMRLVHPDAPHRDLLSEYINSKIEMHETDTFES